MAAQSELVRKFFDYTVRRLLERSENVRDVMNVEASRLVKHLDFSRLELLGRSFVTDAFQEVESDLVYTIPFRYEPTGDLPSGGARANWLEILIYVLIEHQSEPLGVMMDRLLEYILQIRKFDRRRQRVSPRSATPPDDPIVIAMVLYTGQRKWDALTSDATKKLPKILRPYAWTPAPIFLNLQATADTKLRAKAGFFAPVLELIRHRHARREQFEELLRKAARKFERLYRQDPSRAREFFWYTEGLVRHARRAREIEPLKRVVVDAVRHAEIHQEVDHMFKTAADEMYEEIARRYLLMVLEGRFPDEVSEDVVDLVKATDDLATLEEWMRRASQRDSFKEVGIQATK